MSSMSDEERTRRRYETAGRAVYRWVQEVADKVPADMRTTDLGATIKRTRDQVSANYYRAREMWNAGQRSQAANLMSETLRTCEQMTAGIRSTARSTASWRVFLALPGVTETINFVRSANRTVEQLGGAVRDAVSNLGGGLALAGVAVLALLALRK